jgi:signal transduction histidine kinase
MPNEPNEDRGRDSSRRLLHIAEREVGRIILDIHDGPVQNIFAALSQLSIAQRQLSSRFGDEVESEIERIRKSTTLLEHSLNEIRTYMGLFRPPEFERRTLLSVLDGLVIQHEELTGHAVTLNVQGTLPDVSLPVKICLYRVLQQALANAARHADVDQYFVALSSNETQIMMDVVDHGKGFDVAATLEQSEGIHFGLTGMRERVEILDGTFSLQSVPGSGTRVRVVVPYP